MIITIPRVSPLNPVLAQDLNSIADVVENVVNGGIDRLNLNTKYALCSVSATRVHSVASTNVDYELYLPNPLMSAYVVAITWNIDNAVVPATNLKITFNGNVYTVTQPNGIVNVPAVQITGNFADITVTHDLPTTDFFMQVALWVGMPLLAQSEL